jgi:hypothetical protein
MADGTTKPIKDVKVGDVVLATDPETGEHGPRVVTGVWVHDDLVLDLKIDGAVVTTTEDHPFWNATDQQWQQAQNLDSGDHLLTANGATLTIDGLVWVTAHRAPAYNLTVDDIHTYYVIAGNTPVLVHNAPPGGCGPDLDALSASGTSASRVPGLTRAGLEYDKHMKRGQLPTVPGNPASVNAAGQDLLDDILTHPRGVVQPVTGGNFKGGTLIVRPDGTGAIFDSNGTFQYFGQFSYP